MRAEFGPVPEPVSSEAPPPVTSHELTSTTPPISPDSLGDNIVQQEATINPALLKPVFSGTWKNGRPPGYLSEGDWEVLGRYRGLNEPRLDTHDYSVPTYVNGNGNLLEPKNISAEGSIVKVNGRPPGHLSEGDWVVLERNSITPLYRDNGNGK